MVAPILGAGTSLTSLHESATHGFSGSLGKECLHLYQEPELICNLSALQPTDFSVPWGRNVCTYIRSRSRSVICRLCNPRIFQFPGEGMFAPISGGRLAKFTLSHRIYGLTDLDNLNFSHTCFNFKLYLTIL